MTSSIDRVPPAREALKICAVTMARNDCDVIDAFLNQAGNLFDTLYIVDVQSTDGTREAIDARAQANGKIQVVTLRRQEKYQSAITNCLARQAVQEGADWVFLLDVDEFVKVASRADLEAQLRNAATDVLHMRWINLVPERFGSFNAFEADQPFRWRGRTSRYTKVALSSAFMVSNPEFYIHEGSHSVSPYHGGPILLGPDTHLSLLHVPIRSVDRFKYKMRKAYETLLTKHNRVPEEGSHVVQAATTIELATTGAPLELAGLAAHYGEPTPIEPCDPIAEEWPVIFLPEPTLSDGGTPQAKPRTLTETLSRDQALVWLPPDFPQSSSVSAVLRGDEIVIRSRPTSGSGRFPKNEFPALASRGGADLTGHGEQFYVEALTASMMKLKFLKFSAWKELIPTLFALFSIARPRRYVELGTHNGVSFFAACQAGQVLGVGTECIAVDNWIGDPHASFHSDDVFNRFKRNIESQYPDQFYIRANFRQALECFQDGSIDLLHIDGYHTYDAVKDDFETWLPKMSDEGVVIFHDINVHSGDFGVWRFWRELTERYPSFAVFHCHGLGILAVGPADTRLVRIMKALQGKPLHQEFIRTFLQISGTRAIELKETSDRLDEFAAAQATTQAVSAAAADERERSLMHRIEECESLMRRHDAEIRRRQASFDTRAGMYQAVILQLRQQVAALQAAAAMPREPEAETTNRMISMKAELLHLRQQLSLPRDGDADPAVRRHS